MTSPGIEIRWGSYDNYNEGTFKIVDPEQRAALRPKLRRAIGMTHEGLEDHDITLTEKKYLDVYRVKPFYRYGSLAATPTSKTMWLFLRPHQLYGHIDVGFMAHSILHEIIHAIRQEKIPVDTIGEMTATEGLAYVADYLFYERAPIWQYSKYANRPPVVERVAALPKSDIDRRLERLRGALNEDWSGQEGEPWMKPRKESVRGMGEVDILGIAAVYRQVKAGREISEMLHLPTSEVLGLD
jgi:hypothetical protein